MPNLQFPYRLFLKFLSKKPLTWFTSFLALCSLNSCQKSPIPNLQFSYLQFPEFLSEDPCTKFTNFLSLCYLDSCQKSPMPNLANSFLCSLNSCRKGRLAVFTFYALCLFPNFLSKDPFNTSEGGFAPLQIIDFNPIFVTNFPAKYNIQVSIFKPSASVISWCSAFGRAPN